MAATEAIHEYFTRFEDEITEIVAIEFTRAFTLEGTYREIYHVAITREYSQETQFEVVRVIVVDRTTLVEWERVFMS